MLKKHQIIYSTYLHKIIFEYYALKYNNNIPKNFTQKAIRFLKSNAFEVDEYSRNPEDVVQMKCCINFFINNRSNLGQVSQNELDNFIFDLQYYRTQYKKDIDLIIQDINNISPEGIYRLFSSGKIKWYTFYYMLTLCNTCFGTSFVEYEIIKMKIAHFYKLSLYFKHFDMDFIENQHKRVKHILELSKN